MPRLILTLCAACLGVLCALEGASAQNGLSRRRLELPSNAVSSRALQVVGTALQEAEAAPPSQEVSISTRIEFAFNSARLTPSAQRQLSVIAAAINSSSSGGARFLIEGHTDAVGAYDYNLRLSRRRAEAAVAFLTAQGVSFNRLQAIGYGEARLLPGVPSLSAAQRRVEFLILR